MLYLEDFFCVQKKPKSILGVDIIQFGGGGGGGGGEKRVKIYLMWRVELFFFLLWFFLKVFKY